MIGAPSPRAFRGQTGSGGHIDLLPRDEGNIRTAQSFTRIIEGNRTCARNYHGAPVLGRAPNAADQEPSRAPRGERIGVEIDGSGRGNTRRADQTNIRSAGDVDIGCTPAARSGGPDYAGQGHRRVAAQHHRRGVLRQTLDSRCVLAPRGGGHKRIGRVEFVTGLLRDQLRCHYGEQSAHKRSR